MEHPSIKVSEGPSGDACDLYRSTIRRLYLKEDKTLPQVMEAMKYHYSFNASMMYKQRLKLWGIDRKNFRRTEVKQIARQRVGRDAILKPSKFFIIRGREVDMINVLRNVKKHGPSSLQNFIDAASPVVYTSDIECTTPAHSPMLSGQRYECRDHSHPRIADRQEHDRSLYVAFSTTCTSSMTARNPSGARRFLALSPKATSRRLLSLSPVPCKVASPEMLLLPEQLLATFSLYLKGSFEAGAWAAGPDVWLSCKKEHESRGLDPSTIRYIVGVRAPFNFTTNKKTSNLDRYYRRHPRRWSYPSYSSRPISLDSLSSQLMDCILRAYMMSPTFWWAMRTM